jgi:hypothetical protein
LVVAENKSIKIFLQGHLGGVNTEMEGYYGESVIINILSGLMVILLKSF